MTKAIVRKVRRSGATRSSYLCAIVEIGAHEHALGWSVLGGQPVTDRLDPVLAATLLPAMRAASSISLAEPVSSRLLAGVVSIQELLRGWDPTLGRVTVNAPVAPPGQPATGAAAFFSGGIDSFHTALSHIDEIDALVFVHGFDIRLKRRSLLARVSTALQAAASELGKPLIEVRTDIKSMSRCYLGWSWFHGSALASVALLLAPMFGRFYVPGSLSYEYMPPYGSHPALDPLWSTDQMEIIYDGLDLTRLQKTEVVARSSVAMRWLRVCNERGDDGYNCGRCEKCLRTMVALQLLGLLQTCRTLPSSADPQLIRRLTVVRNRDFWEQNVALAERTSAQPRMLEALRSVLDRSDSWRPNWTARWQPPVGGAEPH